MIMAHGIPICNDLCNVKQIIISIQFDEVFYLNQNLFQKTVNTAFNNSNLHHFR